MGTAFNLLRDLIFGLIGLIGTICSGLATLLGDIEEADDFIGGADLTGTTGLSEAGVQETITYDADGNAVGSSTGTRIIF